MIVNIAECAQFATVHESSQRPSEVGATCINLIMQKMKLRPRGAKKFTQGH